MSEEIVIGDVRPRIQAVGDGQQTQFIYPFAIFKEADLEVYLEETLQAGNYSVMGAGESSGGYVVFSIAPENGEIVTLRRRLDIQRTSDFAEGGAFHARVINRELDYLVAVTQQNADDINSRAVLLHPADQDATLVLPAKQDRRNRALAFDETGSPVPGPDVARILTAEQSAEATILAAQQAEEAKVAAEAAAASVDLGLFRKNADEIQTSDVADGAITQAKIDPSVQLGGPSLGTNSIIRTNDSAIVEDITIPVGINGMSAGPITIASANEFLWSQDLTQAVWTDPLAEWSVVNSLSDDPFGNMIPVSSVTISGTTGLIRYVPLSLVEGEVYTYSGYYRLQNGDVSQVSVGQGEGGMGSLGAVQTEWQRLSISFVANGNSFFDIEIQCDVGSSVQVFGNQLTRGSSPVTYKKSEETAAETTLVVEGIYTVVGG